jgi:hypothetical protein
MPRLKKHDIEIEPLESTEMNYVICAQTNQSSAAVDDVFGAACQLAEHDIVQSVHVVVTQKPTYVDLLDYRRRTAAAGLAFMVTGARGALGLRLWRRTGQHDARAR